MLCSPKAVYFNAVQCILMLCSVLRARTTTAKTKYSHLEYLTTVFFTLAWLGYTVAHYYSSYSIRRYAPCWACSMH